MVKWFGRMMGSEEEDEVPTTSVHFQREWTQEMQNRKAVEEKLAKLAVEFNQLKDESQALRSENQKLKESLSQNSSSLAQNADLQAKALQSEKNLKYLSEALEVMHQKNENLKTELAQLKERLWGIAHEAMQSVTKDNS
jgi:predicted RNase H-like nuclease (RuvC/YqgF family)